MPKMNIEEQMPQMDIVARKFPPQVTLFIKGWYKRESESQPS